MDETIREQARTIYRTVDLLKRGVVRRYLHATKDLPCGQVELTLPQLNAMKIIRERAEVSVKEIAEALHVSAASASAMTDRLVELGMVEREQNPVDRREVRIRVSGAGLSTMDFWEEQLLAFIGELLEKMGDRGAKEWCRVYGKLHSILESEMAEHLEVRS